MSEINFQTTSKTKPATSTATKSVFLLAQNTQSWIDPLGLAKGDNRGKQKGKEFRGGTKKRYNWHGFNNKCFQRWYHRVGKQDYNGGDDIQDRADAQRLFEIWEELEKPNVK